jgi:hypothetical protein
LLSPSTRPVPRVGDRRWEATVLTRLGDTHHAAGNPDAARTTWTHALTILTDLDQPDAGTVRTKLTGLDRPEPRSEDNRVSGDQPGVR